MPCYRIENRFVTDEWRNFESPSKHYDHSFQIDAVRRLWRLNYKAGKRAIIQNRTACPSQVADNACHESFHYQAAMQLANGLISTSMRTIVQARLRNIEKRNHQIHTFQHKQHHPQRP